MASDEIGGYVLLACYGLMLLGAVKIFGIRRVLMVVFGIVILGLVAAFSSLGAVSSRRY